MKLTVPQLQGVRYYQRQALPLVFRRQALKVLEPTSEVNRALLDLKLIEVNSRHGHNFRITPAGAALQVQGTVRIQGHILNGHTVLIVDRDPAGLFVIVQVLDSLANYRRGDNLKLQPNQVVST